MLQSFKKKKAKLKKKLELSTAFKLSFCKTFFIFKKYSYLLGCVSFSCGMWVLLLQHVDFSLVAAPWAP